MCQSIRRFSIPRMMHLKKMIWSSYLIIILGTCIIMFLTGKAGIKNYRRNDGLVTQAKRFANPILEGDIGANKETESSSLFTFQESSNDDNTVTDDSDASLRNDTVRNSTGKGKYKLWRAMVLDRYRGRTLQLRQRCLESRSGDLIRMSKSIPQLSYFSSKYNMFVCVSSKAGASTWKTHLLKMKGVKGQKPHTHTAEKLIRSKSILPVPRRHAVKTSPSTVRVLSVRHPIDRLISAYINKLQDGDTMVPRQAQFKFMQMVLSDNDIDLKEDQETKVTFQQFLNTVILEKEKGIGLMNSHWRPQHAICKPCSLPYDYIIKLETFDDDLKLLVDKLNIKEVNPYLKKNSSKSKGKKYEEYFKGIPPSMIREILDLYHYDFYLFDYEVPEFLEKMSHTNSSS